MIKIEKKKCFTTPIHSHQSNEQNLTKNRLIWILSRLQICYFNIKKKKKSESDWQIKINLFAFWKFQSQIYREIKFQIENPWRQTEQNKNALITKEWKIERLKEWRIKKIK